MVGRKARAGEVIDRRQSSIISGVTGLKRAIGETWDLRPHFSGVMKWMFLPVLREDGMANCERGMVKYLID